MKSILDTQGVKGRCLFILNGTSLPWCSSSSSSSPLVEPALPSSACSSCGLCCWQYVSLLSLNPNPFHASEKIPVSCQCFWPCWVGVQVPDPAGVWRSGSGFLVPCCPAHVLWLENSNAVRLLWLEPLGCPSRPPASVCPPPLTFGVGNAPFMVETVEGRDSCISHSSCVVPCFSAALPCT